jgi:hypothetical protein
MSSVSDPRSPARTRAPRQEIVNQYVKCGEQAVEVGEHEATSVVDVAKRNADLRQPAYVPRPIMPAGDSESLI